VVTGRSCSVDCRDGIRVADDLIPVGLRIALRNAVGGWGPYTVREIDDLFNAYGFVDKDDQVEDAGGVRRTLAAAYQARIDFRSADHARRFLDLVDEVLEHYPEDTAEPDPIGAKLRRELQRAGIERNDRGRLELPGAGADAVESLEEATDGVWTPDRIRIFVSHTSSYRQEVGQLAAELDRFAFSCFVAHDAIEPTRQWQDVIELALGTCDVLIAYVTPDFAASRWTDQEVGWALGRGVVVIPIKAGADPYGFFGAYQALAVPEGQRLWETAVAVTRAISVAVFRKQRPGAARLLPRLTDLVVEAFCRSSSFEATRRRYELISLIPRSAWNDEHLARLEKAMVENSQIRDGVLQLPGPRPAPEAIAELVARVRARD
jgi:hypothetical protein